MLVPKRGFAVRAVAELCVGDTSSVLCRLAPRRRGGSSGFDHYLTSGTNCQQKSEPPSRTNFRFVFVTVLHLKETRVNYLHTKIEFTYGHVQT